MLLKWNDSFEGTNLFHGLPSCHAQSYSSGMLSGSVRDQVAKLRCCRTRLDFPVRFSSIDRVWANHRLIEGGLSRHDDAVLGADGCTRGSLQDQHRNELISFPLSQLLLIPVPSKGGRFPVVCKFVYSSLLYTEMGVGGRGKRARHSRPVESSWRSVWNKQVGTETLVWTSKLNSFVMRYWGKS